MLLALLTTLPAQAAPEAVDEVLRALSNRHPLPCADIEALSPTPVDTLLHVVDEVTMPPWAPMRAAECLVAGHALEVRAHLQRWVVAPELKGLGRLVLGELDRLPVEVAVEVARKAVTEGPEPELAKEKAAACALPEVRAVVEPR